MYKSNIENDNRMWQKHGFYIHLEKNNKDNKKLNYHTHGILHSRGHADFLIIQPIDPTLAKMTFIELVDMLDQGLIITEGMIIGDFLGDLTLEFSKPKNNDNGMVLQVIVKGLEFRSQNIGNK